MEFEQVKKEFVNQMELVYEISNIRNNVEHSIIILMKQLNPIGRRIVLASFCSKCGAYVEHEEGCENSGDGKFNDKN